MLFVHNSSYNMGLITNKMIFRGIKVSIQVKGAYFNFTRVIMGCLVFMDSFNITHGSLRIIADQHISAGKSL